mgnify:CR=1 FL=1
MSTKFKENGVYLGVLFGLLVLTSLIKELVFYLKDSFSDFGNAAYAIFWMALLAFLIYYYLKKIKGVDPWKFLFLSVLVGFLVSLIGLIINRNLGTDELLEKIYIGVYGASEEFDTQNETEVYIDHKTYVFKNSDRIAKRELRNLENEYGESYHEEFVFWQTAFVNGFQPKNIPDFTGTDSFSKKLTLFFTLGPVFILETFINSIMSCWILMLIPVIALLFKAKLLEKALKPFLDFFKRRTEKTAAKQ